MSDYIIVDGELYHYGVKGMKWGVRRDIKAKARTAALYNQTIKWNSRTIDRLQKKKATKGLTNRQAKKLAKIKKIRKEYEELRAPLIKDLSVKDIKQGERGYWLNRIFGLAPLSSEIVLADRAGRAVQREKKKG